MKSVIRKAAALAIISPTLVLSCEKNAAAKVEQAIDELRRLTPEAA